MRTSGILLAIAGIALCGQVSAQTESISFDVPLSSFFGGGFLDSDTGQGESIFDSDTISGVPKFDPALGTLEQVNISTAILWDVYVDVYGEVIDDQQPFDGVADPMFVEIAIGYSPSGGNTTHVRNQESFGLPVFCDSFARGGGGFQCFGSDGISSDFITSATYTTAENILNLTDFIGVGDVVGLKYFFVYYQVDFFLDNLSYLEVDVYTEVFGDPGDMLTIEYVYTPANDPDSDGDGVADSTDNCTNVANAGQEDTNGDGFGNACDGDFNGDCQINLFDLITFKNLFGSSGAPSDGDFNGDQNVNLFDLITFKALFGGQPGPSAQAACPQ